MIYLDNAATTFPKPEVVYDTVDRVQRTIAVNVGRGSYQTAREAMGVVDETRTRMAELVHAAGPERVVLTPSATIAANEILLGLEWDNLKNVYLTPFEHNAIARPLERLRRQYGFSVRLIPFDGKTQKVDLEKTKRLFSSFPPDYVFLNHVSNVTGAVVPLSELGTLAKQYDAVVTVDGSQSVGLLPYDLRTQPIDYLIFAGHKNLYASWGIGGFVVNSSYPLRPFLAGGTGSDSLNLLMAEEAPGGFEFASPNIIAIASLNASLQWLRETTLEAIAAKKQGLMERLIIGFRRHGARLYLPGEGVEHTSVLAFNVPEYTAEEIGTILSEDFDIAVRTGFQCAPYVHDLIGSRETMGVVRASVGYFNTEDDIDALIGAIADL